MYRNIKFIKGISELLFKQPEACLIQRTTTDGLPCPARRGERRLLIGLIHLAPFSKTAPTGGLYITPGMVNVKNTKTD